MKKDNLQLKMLRLHYMHMINYVYVGVDRETRKAFVVDPAWNMKEIEAAIEREDAVLDKVFLTHSHMDHVNLANDFAKKYGVPVYMSQAEIAYYHFHCTNLTGFSDGERIRVGASDVLCILTPGHTKGSTCYLVNGHLFTGDTIFIEGCGLCEFHGGSAEEMYRSFQKLKHYLEPDTLIYPGHRYKDMPGQTFEYVLEHNIYFSIMNEDAFVNFRNRKNIKNTFRFL